MAKQIIENKIYDTWKSTRVASNYREILYRTTYGYWFLRCKRGMNDDRHLRPIPSKEAFEWLCKNAKVRAINKYFPDTIEEA